MQVYLLARNPTDSVTDGYLPAARRLGMQVILLSDQPNAHEPGDGVRIIGCDVRDFRAVIATVAGLPRPAAVFTNSDHLQTQAALTAEYFGLPGKPWRAALRAKDKALMRSHLVGTDAGVTAAVLPAGASAEAVRDLAVPLPCVLKPREGVASEDVVLARSVDELVAAVADVRSRRKDALVVEEYLPGELLTLETLGDGHRVHVLGGFRTRLSPPPHFVEESLTYVVDHPSAITEQVLAQLTHLGVGFGACHTEFVVVDGRARLIEVNYRSIGDQCDLLLADLLEIPYFEHVWRVHLGHRLPDDLGRRRDAAARLDYPCADRAGTLRVAPGPSDITDKDVRLSYRPLRNIGDTHPLHRTNRDYLGVLRTIGRDADGVDRAATAHLAAMTWRITA